MTDTDSRALPVSEVVAELESSDHGRGPVPFLWLAIVMLVTAAVVTVYSGAAEKPEAAPQARLAAAAGALDEVDFAFSTTIEMDATEHSEPLTVDGNFDADTRRIRATATMLGSDTELIQDGAVVFLRFGQGNSLGAATGGKPWGRMDVSGMVDESAAAAPIGQNPLDAYAQLGKITSPIVRVGEERVRGEPTIHFRTTVDASGMAPATTNEGTLASLRNVVVDVWLDEHDRPRRHRQEMTLVEGGATTVIATTESFDYGKAVTIDLPPPDQVGEFDPMKAIQENLDTINEAMKKAAE